ncbi:unnamed protein product [Mytilus coruscus]|uniref:Endonuclease/exonuclease/phosphatase domain-containing protein n=1 Tax=Mytilus coruscus TaxID=42192 RepID=A0A6J8EWE1_MYTCO|nr:unnamed protein product [Mytilus coruscus]
MMMFLLLITSGTIHHNPGPSGDLSVCHLNARSLYSFDSVSKSNQTKLDEIESVLCNEFQYDVICISETWLKPDISFEDIKIDNYNIHRRDRADGSGYGGVAIYVSDRLYSMRRQELEIQGLEFLCIEVKTKDKSILVSVCYRPLTVTANERRKFTDSFTSVVENMKSHSPDVCLILGDFNDRENLNPRKFWSLSKSVLGYNSDRAIPPLKDNMNLISDDLEKAELLNCYFSAQMHLGQHENDLPALPPLSFLTVERLQEIVAVEQDVLKYLRQSNPHKSCGPDGISNHILKYCAQSLHKPLTKLFNFSLRSGVYPSLWKVSNVCPVYKNKGDKNIMSNISTNCTTIICVQDP